MSTEQPDTGEAIKIALASAETASDAASLAEDTSKKLSDKADWVDRKLIPAAIGGMVGIVICTGLSAMVYYRTLSDLRTARDTHVEALHLFTQNVNQLKMTVEEAQDLIASQSAERQMMTNAFDDINTKIDTLAMQLTESSALTDAALGEGPGGFAGRLNTLIEPQIDQARDDVLAGISDLQLALSQKLSSLANQIVVTGSATATGTKPTTTTTASAARSHTPPKTVIKPRTKPSSSTPPRKTASKSTSNPFSYP